MSQPPPETWRSDDGSFVLHYPPRVLEEIRAEIVMALHGPGRGGVETGGVLIGGPSGVPGEFHLEGWRPIRCDHSRGASFLLSSRDVAALACQVEGLSGGGTGGVLGWFAAHTRGEFGLRAEEQQLHGRVFPEQAPLFMIVAPEKFGDADIRFYLITGGAQPSAALIPGRLRLAPAPGLARPGEAPSAPAPRLVRKNRSSPRRWILPGLAIVSALVFLAAGWRLWNSPRAEAPAPPPVPQPIGEPLSLSTLHIARQDDRIEISWDSFPLETAGVTATLTVLDQGRAFVRRLSPAEFALGRIEYTRPTSEIRVSLLLERNGSPSLLARTHFQGPPPSE